MENKKNNTKIILCIVITIIVVAFITIGLIVAISAAVIFTSAEPPAMTKLAVFKNEITILQETVLVKSLTNYVNGVNNMDEEIDKYEGIVSNEVVTGENINNELGSDIILYKFDANASKTLELESIENLELNEFCLDKETGIVYHIKGVVAEENGIETVYYNFQTFNTENIPKSSINVADY